MCAGEEGAEVLGRQGIPVPTGRELLILRYRGDEIPALEFGENPLSGRRDYKSQAAWGGEPRDTCLLICLIIAR